MRGGYLLVIALLYIVSTAAVCWSFRLIRMCINVTALGRIVNVNINPLNNATSDCVYMLEVEGDKIINKIMNK